MFYGFTLLDFHFVNNSSSLVCERVIVFVAFDVLLYQITIETGEVTTSTIIVNLLKLVESGTRSINGIFGILIWLRVLRQCFIEVDGS